MAHSARVSLFTTWVHVCVYVFYTAPVLSGVTSLDNLIRQWYSACMPLCSVSRCVTHMSDLRAHSTGLEGRGEGGEERREEGKVGRRGEGKVGRGGEKRGRWLGEERRGRSGEER